MKHLCVETLDDAALIQAIESAKWRVHFYAPGVSSAVADALIQKEKEFRVERARGARGLNLFRREGSKISFLVALDVSEDVIKLGYGEPKAFQRLWGHDTENSSKDEERWFYHAENLRLGLLIVDDTSILYTPHPRLMESQKVLEQMGPNGITLPHEVLLKESYQKRLEPIAKRLVALSDVEQLTSIPIKTREEIEEKVAALEKNAVAQRAEIEAVKNELRKKEDELEKKKKEINKYRHPPVTRVELSFKGFDLKRMRFDLSEDVLAAFFPNKEPDEIKAALHFSNAELADISRTSADILIAPNQKPEEWDYTRAKNLANEIRLNFIYHVKYDEQDFITGKVREKSQPVLLASERQAFIEEIRKFRVVASCLQIKIMEATQAALLKKMNRIFGVKIEEKLFKELTVRLFDIDLKFNPDVDVREDPIYPEVYDSDIFKIGLKNILLERSIDDKIGFRENRALELLKKCNGDIDELYKLCAETYLTGSEVSVEE